MLEPAIKYKDQLEVLQFNTWFEDKYKYWNSNVYYDQWIIDQSSWNRHQFVSVHNGVVLGLISYNISRSENSVDRLSIINFSDNKFIFGKDVMQAITDIFQKFHFRKLSFTVVIGNPIEKTYDRLVHQYGGRIVGIQKDEVKLMDGKYYDLKLYEIMASDLNKLVEVER